MILKIQNINNRTSAFSILLIFLSVSLSIAGESNNSKIEGFNYVTALVSTKYGTYDSFVQDPSRKTRNKRSKEPGSTEGTGSSTSVETKGETGESHSTEDTASSGTQGTQEGTGREVGSKSTEGPGSATTQGEQDSSGSAPHPSGTGESGSTEKTEVSGTQGEQDHSGSAGNPSETGESSPPEETGPSGPTEETVPSGTRGEQDSSGSAPDPPEEEESVPTEETKPSGTQGEQDSSGSAPDPSETAESRPAEDSGLQGSPATESTNDNVESSGDNSETIPAGSLSNFEILVEPYRNIIYNGEQTTITIDLHSFDSAGQKIQGFRQEVELHVTGLVDGTVVPGSGKIILDNIGIAWIYYKAGEKDKQIKISAVYTPEDNSPAVKNEAAITVKPLEYEATLTLDGTSTNRVRSSYTRKQSDGIERGNYSSDERTGASFYVPLKLENAGDMPMINQRWEYYKPLDINLSSFKATYRSKQYDYSSHSGFGVEQTIIKNKNPLKSQIPEKEYLLRSNIILIIDKKTDKVVKIATLGFPVEFYWDETENRTGRSWNPDGSEPINDFNHKTDDLSTIFTPGPVEDPVPDPTITSTAESLRTYLKNLGTPLPGNIEIPEEEEKAEIEPDLLVKYGDGKTFFGGRGKKIIDNSEGTNISRKEMTFNWSVTRRKKPL